MIHYPPTGFKWPTPWETMTAEVGATSLEFPKIMSELFGGHNAASTLEGELQRECCPTHPLHGINCLAIARATDDPNEFVFATDDPQFPVAFVHLTWAIETSPSYPRTTRYRSWEEFQAAWSSNSG
jgi:hypothetical protein